MRERKGFGYVEKEDFEEVNRNVEGGRIEAGVT